MRAFKFYPLFLICFYICFTGSYIYSQTPPPTPSSPPVETSEKKELGPLEKQEAPSDADRFGLVHMGDTLEIDVVGSSEYDWRGKLNPEGFLDGPAAIEEPVYGLCRKVEDIAADIAKIYSKILRDPEVKVRIIDSSGRANVILYGAVRISQRFLLKRPVYLNELLILSGGIVENASGEVEIIRSRALSCEEKQPEQDGESRNITLLLSDLLKGKKEANPLIMSGDLITLVEARPIYVIGGVANPKKINSRSEMTVSRAIASAGGLTRYADSKKIVIFRRDGRETSVITLDLEKIKSKEAEDLLLKPYDVLEVGQVGKSSSKFPPVVRTVENSERKDAVLPLKIID